MRKKLAQNRHAKRRALERYGLKLTTPALKKIVAQIRNGQAAFVESQSNRVKKFLVIVEGKEILVVYDNKRHTVVTFLPENARELEKQ